MAANFPGLVLLCLSVTRIEFKEDDKEFGTYRRISISAYVYMISWSVVYFDELNYVKVSNLRFTLF